MLSNIFTEMTLGSEGPKILSPTMILTVLYNNRGHLYINYRKLYYPKDYGFKIILIYYELLQTFRKDMMKLI